MLPSPIREIFPGCCASATSGARHRLRARASSSELVSDVTEAARARCLRAHRPRCRRLHDRLESSCANPVFGVPTVVEARDAHVLACLPGMDETAAADVNPAMTKAIE